MFLFVFFNRKEEMNICLNGGDRDLVLFFRELLPGGRGYIPYNARAI